MGWSPQGGGPRGGGPGGPCPDLPGGRGRRQGGGHGAVTGQGGVELGVALGPFPGDGLVVAHGDPARPDRKSTRLNSVTI